MREVVNSRKRVFTTVIKNPIHSRAEHRNDLAIAGCPHKSIAMTLAVCAP